MGVILLEADVENRVGFSKNLVFFHNILVIWISVQKMDVDVDCQRLHLAQCVSETVGGQ